MCVAWLRIVHASNCKSMCGDICPYKQSCSCHRGGLAFVDLHYDTYQLQSKTLIQKQHPEQLGAKLRCLWSNVLPSGAQAGVVWLKCLTHVVVSADHRRRSVERCSNISIAHLSPALPFHSSIVQDMSVLSNAAAGLSMDLGSGPSMELECSPFNSSIKLRIQSKCHHLKWPCLSWGNLSPNMML